MKWANLSLSKKLMFPIAGVGLLLILLSFVLISTMDRLSSDFAHINEQYIPSIEFVLNADRDLYQAQIAERSIALGISNDAFEKMHSENLDQVKRRVSQITEMNVAASAHEYAKKFLKQFSIWRPKSERLVAGVVNGSISVQSAGGMSTGQLDKEFESMRDTLDKLGENLGEEAAKLQAATVDLKNGAMTQVIVMVIIAVAITAAIAIYFPRLIVGPVNELTSVLEELSTGKGDLTKRMPRMGEDEIGKMAHSFNRFMKGLRTLIQSIQGVAGEVRGASEHLKEGAGDSQSISEQYAQSMTVVSTANHEMGLAIQEVSLNTQQVSEEAKASDKAAKAVSSQFKKAVTEIQDLAANVTSSGEVIGELVEETKNIESMLDVIKGIAEQTNLLALNAAIEAARAGEQGRGFAVVADEVRTLASKTQQSTEDINQMIEKLRGGVNRAVQSMQSGQEKADRTVEYAQASEGSIQEISSSLMSITDRILQVASAVEEQTSVIDEINNNLEGVNELSKNGMSAAKMIGSSVEGLNGQAAQLSQQTSSFKVS